MGLVPEFQLKPSFQSIVIMTIVPVIGYERHIVIRHPIRLSRTRGYQVLPLRKTRYVLGKADFEWK